MEAYGLDLSKFKKPPTQLEIELLYVGCDKPEEHGGLSLAEHYKNIIKILYPWAWEYWHEWNELCLWAWCNYEEIGMTGCAAAHKTFTFSLISYISWLANPTKTALILTSTSIPSLRGRIWKEITNFHDKATIPFDFNVVDSLQKIQSAKGDDKHAIRAIAVDSGKVEEAVGKIQGIHAERMLVLVDEAAQTPPAIFSARANLSTGTKFYRFVAIANASSQYDQHGIFCTPKAGWKSITDQDESWETKSGVCIHFDGLKSPNVKRKAKHFPLLFDQDAIESTKNNFGEDSLEWWSYVRGFWPPKGIRNTVLDFSIINTGRATENPIWMNTEREIYASLDPAFTTEGDKCILRFAQVGMFDDGTRGIYLTDIIRIDLVESTDNPINYQIANRVIEECVNRGVKPNNFTMDATSASGLADIISQHWSSAINRVEFGSSPTDSVASPNDERPAKQVYKNRVTQLWYNVNRTVMAKAIRGMDAETCLQFTTRQYELKGKITEIESKKVMKQRTGGKSPDEADAAALLVDLFLTKNDVKKMYATSEAETADWKKLTRRFGLCANYLN